MLIKERTYHIIGMGPVGLFTAYSILTKISNSKVILYDKREESKLVIDNNYDKYKEQIEGSMHRALSKFKNGYRRFNK